MWYIEYDNETGLNDDFFVEWWNITNGEKLFKASNELDAQWLCDLLNNSL